MVKSKNVKKEAWNLCDIFGKSGVRSGESVEQGERNGWLATPAPASFAKIFCVTNHIFYI